ncbi:hypothetical protein IHE55_15630 [Streptomyces pactum]|uniref:DUF4190 domain-containing protein n=1 Tax=Streptomyces pactum TaxID=68249 RepID=A0ABS0NM06_9ACTN|nr:hypothetical protein [Streptomyces pactum]MBH5336137.1 hypothetical protein [Streptomyces pactum]
MYNNTQLLAANSVDDLKNNIFGVLTPISIALVTLSLMFLGFRLLMSVKKGDGMREAFQGVGLIAVATILIAGAAGLTTVLFDLGNDIGNGPTNTP